MIWFGGRSFPLRRGSGGVGGISCAARSCAYLSGVLAAIAGGEYWVPESTVCRVCVGTSDECDCDRCRITSPGVVGAERRPLWPWVPEEEERFRN